MEEILVLILQGTFELILELLAYGGIDFLAGWSFSRQEKEGKGGCVVVFVFFLVGLGLGWLANVIQPRHFLPEAWMRLTNLLLGPPLVGAMSWAIAEWRRRGGKTIRPGLHFWLAFWFVLAFDLMRFIYAKP